MKKISILALHLGYGGIEKSIVALANALAPTYQVEIVCSYKLYEEPVFKLDERVKVIYLLPDLKPNREDFKSALHHFKIIDIFKEGFKGTKTLYLRRKTMINYIKTTKANVVIATRDIFDNWLGEYGSSKITKIGWEHNHYHNDMKYADSITRAAWKLDYLVLVSKSLQEFYQHSLMKSHCRCFYIPNIIDSIPHFIAPLAEKRLVSVGRLSPEKGYMDLLKIYYLISKDYPDWVLDIVGDGTERPFLEDFIKSHNLESKVTLHGFQSKEYIDNILNKSSIYVMTSFTESFGIVLLEAMSHGLPCIAFSSAEGARELISSGKNGYLINNRSYVAIIKKIEDLMNDQKERQRIGLEARKDIKKYTPDNVKKYWYRLIEKK
jgi:glycosyltransferase involved in cell wall biosynthesis